MFVLVFLLSIFGACLAATPLEETPYYTIYALSDVELTKRLPAGVRTFSDNSRTIIEEPYNGTVPSDSGGNFGDIEFSTTLKNGTLIARDTIINNWHGQDILLYYHRAFPGYYIEDFKLLNFGRERGWVWWAGIAHTAGEVETEVLIEARKEIRLFAETYIREA